MTEPQRFVPAGHAVQAMQYTGDNNEAIVDWLKTKVPYFDQEDDDQDWPEQGVSTSRNGAGLDVLVVSLKTAKYLQPSDWAVWDDVCKTVHYFNDPMFKDRYRIGEVRAFGAIPPDNYRRAFYDEDAAFGAIGDQE